MPNNTGYDPSLYGRAPERQEGGGLLDVDDVLLGGFRAAEGLVRGIVGLVDVIPGVDTGIGEGPRLTGDPDTALGGLYTGALQFLMGFLPVAGQLAKLGTISAAGRTVNLAGTGARAVALRGTIAGAAVDFAGYDGNEARLSNLLMEYPALQNPVSDFLKADEDDAEAVGRFKNVLEGLGMGAVAEGIAVGLKGLRAGRRALKEGKDKVAAQEAASDAAMKTEEAQRVLGELPSAGPEARASRPVDELPPELAAQTDNLLEGPPVKAPPAELVDDKGIPLKAGLDPNAPSASRKDKAFNALAKDFLKLSPAQIRDMDEILKTADEMDPIHVLNLVNTKVGMNLSNIVSSEGAARTLAAVADIFDGRSGLSGRTFDELRDQAQFYLWRIASIVGDNPVAIERRLIGDLKENTKSLKKSSSIFVAAETVLAAMMEDFQRLRATPNVTDEILDARLEALTSMASAISASRHSRGEALNIAKLQVDQRSQAFVAAQGFLSEKNTKSKDVALNILDRLMQAEDAGEYAALLKFLEQSRGKRSADRLIHAFLGSILSGVKTLAVQAGAPPLLKAWEMSSQVIGGGLMALGGREGGGAAVKHVWHDLVGLSKSFGDSLRVAKYAWKVRKNPLNPGTTAAWTEAYGYQKPFSAASFGLREDSAAGIMANTFDYIIGIPFRALGGTDAGFHQLFARSQMWADLATEADRRGLAGADFDKFMEQGMDKAFWQNMLISDEQLKLRGLQNAKDAGITERHAMERHAQEFIHSELEDPLVVKLKGDAKLAAEDVQYSTQTQDLREGSLTAKVQHLILQVPMLRLFFPFFKTPVNLLGTAADNVPVYHAAKYISAFGKTALDGGLSGSFGRTNKALQDSHSRLLRELQSSNPRVKARAQGRLVMSIGFFSTAVGYAMSGRVTGRGPEDLELRRSMEAAGWQPYSIRLDLPGMSKPAFVQYARLDPFSTILGAIADFAEGLRLASDEEQGAIEGFTAATVGALTSQLVEKSYLQGLSHLVSVLEDGPTMGARVVNQKLSAIIPNFVAQFAGASDDNVRELQGLADTLRARIPGLRKDLRPRRNLLGEVVNRPRSVGEDPLGWWTNAFSPVLYRQVTDDAIFEELTALKHGFSPPRPALLGVDLREYRHAGNQDAYDRWQQQVGVVRVRDKTLRQSLRKLINSKEYQKMDPVSTVEFDSPRVRAIRSIIQKYRKAALDKIFKEIPTLRLDYEAAMRRKEESKTGGGLQALLKTQSGLPTYIDQIQANKEPRLF